MFWQIAKTICLLVPVISTGCATLAVKPQVKLPSIFNRTKASNAVDKDRKDEETPQESAPRRQPLIARTQESANRRHDPQTQALIAAELADADPQEREEWQQYLATIDAAMIPYALQSRRIKSGTVAQTAFALDEFSTQNSAVDLARGEELTAASGSSIDPKLPSETPSISTAAVPTEGPNTENSLPSEEEIQSRPDPLILEETQPRDWSGKLKSFTEWERNPLNFSRESELDQDPHRKDRRPRSLPKIIANPFAKEIVDEEPGRNFKGEPLHFDPPESQRQLALATDQLRISPGAKLWEEELHKLVSLMAAEASASGRSGMLTREELRQQVALRMLYLVNHQTELAMQPIPGLQPSDQEFWTSLFWGLSNYLNQQGLDPAERSTKTIEQFRSATRYLQLAANLQLRNVCFCSRINGFGSYELFDVDEFTAGQPVLIYCDIRNFQSSPTESGEYVTKLRSSLEIYQTGNQEQLIERSPFPATEDRCRNMRSDYYHSYRIDLPEELTPGPYVLKLNVHDELSGKSVTETLSFSIR